MSAPMTPLMLVTNPADRASRSATVMSRSSTRSPAKTSAARADDASMPSSSARVTCSWLVGAEASRMKSPAMSPNDAATTTAP